MKCDFIDLEDFQDGQGGNMKYIILTLLLILWAGCDLPADNDPKNVIVIWDANPEPDLSHYEFYFWQSDDNSNWSRSNLQYLYDVPHSFAVDSIMSDSLSVTLNYFAAGAIAVDSSGQKSNMGYSNIYSYAEFFAPGAPKNIRINK